MRARLVTPRVPGAIAIIQIDGDVDAALEAIGAAPLPTGERRLSDLCGVDRGLLVRWSESCLQLMPHGGPAVVDGLLEQLRSLGVPISQDPIGWPEAEDDVEALALEAIARAASPAAVPMLLSQPSRWNDKADEQDIAEHSRVLNRLIEAPTIVAVGKPNIGKSALCNALAGARIALVADEAGVTRDHVGVAIRLGAGMDAVVVRWIDTPGLSESDATCDLDEAAQSAAAHVIRVADAVVLCGDADSGFIDADRLPIPDGAQVLRVGLRDDLGRIEGADVSTSAKTGGGLAELAEALREAIVPAESLQWQGPWRFDPRLPARPR